MNKITFENLPSTNTPVNASNLNLMQSNIENAINNDEIYTLSATTGWKRIAEFSGMAGATISIMAPINNGEFLQLSFASGAAYRTLLMNEYTTYTNTMFITKARLVHKGGSTGYLEIYQNVAEEKQVHIRLNHLSNGVSLLSSETAGNVPSGYSTREINIENGFHLQNLENAIYYKSGDTINFSTGISFSGYVTADSKNIALTIMPPKKLDNISSVTVNTLTLNIRGITGYIIGSNTDYKQYVYSSYITSNKDAIYIDLRKSDGWGVTNNTPLSISPSINAGISLTVT